MTSLLGPFMVFWSEFISSKCFNISLNGVIKFEDFFIPLLRHSWVAISNFLLITAYSVKYLINVYAVINSNSLTWMN